MPSQRIPRHPKRARNGYRMKKHRLHATAVAAVFSRESERIVRWYAEMLTGHRNARVCAIRQDGSACKAKTNLAQEEAIDPVPAAIRQLARAHKIGMIVSDWSTRHSRLQALLRLADEFSVPAVFIRQENLVPVERVVVATAGGPNVLELMWIAKEIASALHVPVSILHCRRGTCGLDSTASDFETIPLERLSVRILGMHAAIETSNGRDITKSVAAFLRKNDLLVLGAPSPLRRTMAFADSLPDLVARKVAAPLILLSSPPPAVVSLRRLFWGNLIKTGIRVRHKQEALSVLIKNLAHHNQLPGSCQSDILDRALRREKIMSTAVDCETAFPHVMLRGVFGVFGSMAVCPAGVDFGSSDGSPTRFLYLLITPHTFCEDYLAILSKIARRMVNPEIREALLACETPAQVLDILEPRDVIPAPKRAQRLAYRSEDMQESQELADAPPMEAFNQ